MNTMTNLWKSMLAGLYAWIVTIFFGAVLLDVVYANLAFSAFKPAQTALLFSKVADLLLLIGALTLLSAIGAIGSAWRQGPTRNLFIASCLCVLLPLLLYPLVGTLQANLGFNIGRWVRLASGALSSILAFMGLWKLHSSDG